MHHPASHDLLRSIFWPLHRGQPRRHGVLKWEREFERLAPLAANETRVSVTASLCNRHLVLKSQHTFANGESKPGLEIRWDWVPGKAPALVHFSHEGHEQPLVEAAALNRFKGQVYRMNVAPNWAR